MPKVTITSKHYPGISLVVPELPGVEPPTSGSHFFASGVAYDCTDATIAAIRKLFAGFEERVSSKYSIQVSGAEVSAIAVAVSDPVPAPTKSAESAGSDETPTVIEDVAELSDEDLDLIDVEISKIDGMSIKEAEPILIATGGNTELPRLLRKTYLEMVIEHPSIQKKLKDVASKLLEQI